jgi:hypothetical protein
MIFFTLNQLLILVILLFIRNMEFSTAFGTIWPQKESIKSPESKADLT